ncbi:MAG TPA: aminopeptidase P family protein [Peptococcaceae bacterium]|nr:aminopeptidase P family protein [Peptococcaceae bacterium]
MRIAKVRQKLEEKGYDALLIKSLPNIYYLSGFTSEDAWLLLTFHNNYLLTDFRYLEQAAGEAKGFEIVRVDNNLEEVLAKLTLNLKIIGIEEDVITWAEYRKIIKALENQTLADASAILKELRQVKEPAEIETIRQAVRITDEALAEVLGNIRVGHKEEEIALNLELALRRRGASGKSFEFIVASGKRSSLPHGTASGKRLERGELLTLDFGAKYQWYCSDLTRTVILGKPEPKQQEIYNIVLEAQLAALAAIKPGMSGQEVDAVAREIIKNYGYGEYFGHGLGHSVGLEIHESPRFSITEKQIIEPGMIMTVEPGIYIPGWGGVRIEDMVLVTKNGVEVLTQASKQFIIID